MEDKRAKALKGLTGNSNNDYKRLSDGTVIGKNVLDDLEKYMELELKYKYKVDANNWKILSTGKEYTENITNPDGLKDVLNEEYKKGTHQPPTELKVKQPMKSYNINFNTCIELTNRKYARPVVKKNTDSRLKARIVIDKNELDKIFKKTNISSLDGLVLLEFYSEFNKKYKNLKNYLLSNDSNIKKDIVEDLYNKLISLYDIKIKEGKGVDSELENVKKYIKDDYINKYNSMKMAGGAVTDKELLESLLTDITGTAKAKSLTSDKRILESLLKDIKVTADTKKAADEEGGVDEQDTSDSDENSPSADSLMQEVSENSPSTEGISSSRNADKKESRGSENGNVSTEQKKSDVLKGKYDELITKVNEKKDKILTSFEIEDDNDDIDDDDNSVFDMDLTPTDLELNNLLSSNQKNKTFNLYNFIENMRRTMKGAMKGGAGNDPKKQEKELPTLSDHFNSLRDVAVKILTIYYKLIEKPGGEEATLKEFFKSNDEESPSPPPDTITPTNSNEIITATGDKNVIIAKILENEKTSKILDGKANSLKDILKEITPLFINLYKICNEIKNIPEATEYEDSLKKILNTLNIRFFEKKDDNEKHKQHPIIRSIIKEINKTSVDISDNKLELKSLESQKTAKEQESRDNAAAIALAQRYPTAPLAPPPAGTVAQEIPKEPEQEIKPKFISPGVYKEFEDLQKALVDFVKELKDNVENVISGDGNKAKNTKDMNIFDKIWSNYNEGMNRNDYKTPNEKFKNQFNSLREGRKLYDSVLQNNLDPELILEINLQDKATFIFLIFLIRTIIIIAIEFLIEYNMIQTLQFSIILYGFAYLLILCLFIVFVNYDSYKLRIIFNYLNLHINSSNIMLHIILFAVFTALVYIIIQSDNFLKNFGNMFDYTNIYNHIYDMKSMFTEDSEGELSRNEKLKLLYRTDIISMIVFIFASCLILIM